MKWDKRITLARALLYFDTDKMLKAKDACRFLSQLFDVELNLADLYKLLKYYKLSILDIRTQQQREDLRFVFDYLLANDVTK